MYSLLNIFLISDFKYILLLLIQYHAYIIDVHLQSVHSNKYVGMCISIKHLSNGYVYSCIHVSLKNYCEINHTCPSPSVSG